ncbi:DUF512 domain-containing protein [Desulfolucanica intricata]|uniref:DUF512 domain-containing protein n=1 Tax=Desulfolucanica intricata TaxID=1285191 RepID=UPI0008374FCB|nr:DUF512 domain-containing protein [Desulfolucanica intricata]
MGQQGLQVARVVPGSIADELGVEIGDQVQSINGQPVRDVLDYRFLTADEELEMVILKNNQEDWILEIEKDYEEDLGLDFGDAGFGHILRCQNRCIFCFVEQMPAGMRKSLYIKDDDFRLSFLHGNFITLTNLRPQDLERIVKQRLSPLYVSVHSTNPVLREKILGHAGAGKIMEQLSFLTGNGIDVHTQIVLSPGVNDGNELKRTVRDLSTMWPHVLSIAVVPVGLTKYRDNLYKLRTFTPQEAGHVVSFIGSCQKKFLEELGYPLVFASDEFYLLSGTAIPATEIYADFPQTENGVGLVRLFLDEWEDVLPILPKKLSEPRRITAVTGILASAVLAPVIDRLNLIENLEVCLRVVVNKYFGEHVTVAGLLTASDLEQAFQGTDLGDLLILPSVMLREGETVFLDDVTVKQLAGRLKVPIAVVDGPAEMIKIIIERPEKVGY